MEHEKDPLGRDPHQPGAKLDAGKTRAGLAIDGFARAIKDKHEGFTRYATADEIAAYKAGGAA